MSNTSVKVALALFMVADPSKTEPSWSGCGVENVVPTEEHSDSCETETR